MSNTCEHVGKEPPSNFQCTSCEDTADKCNCNFCGMVWCEKCQAMISVDCDDVRIAWDRRKKN